MVAKALPEVTAMLTGGWAQFAATPSLERRRGRR